MKYLLLLLLIPSLAFATNKPKPVKVSQGQMQGQLQGQVSVNKNDNKNINVNKAIADVKNNLKLTNKLYGGDSKSSATLLQGDTNSFSGGNSFFSGGSLSLPGCAPDTIGFAGGVTNDGGPYDSVKGGGFCVNSSWGVGRDLKEAEASLFKAKASILERNAARDDALATMELARDKREADKDEVEIRLGCSELHYAGHVSKDTICEGVEFTDVHHTPEVSKSGLMRDPGHKD